MSSRSNIPHKGDIVINPKTSRPVKVGGSVWRKLVKEGVLSGHYQDPKVLDEYTTENDWKIKQKILKQQLPDEYVPSRGKGMYKGKIVKRVNPYESVKSKAKKGARTLAQQYEDFDEDELRKMLMESMSIGKKKTKPSYSVKSKEATSFARPKGSLTAQRKLIVSEEDDSDDDESTDDDEESDSDF